MKYTKSQSPTSQVLLSTAVEYDEGGRCFVADETTGEIRAVQDAETPPLDLPTFKKLIHFPSSVAAKLDLNDLVAALTAEVQATGCLPPASARLAQFIVATWSTDSLP